MHEGRNMPRGALEAVGDKRRPASEPKAEEEPNSLKVSAPPPLFLARFCEAWVHAGICTVGVSLMERDKR